MKPERDAFGQALMSYLSGGDTQYVIERDDGYLDILETGEYFTGYDDWPAHEKEAMKHVRGRVLDVGCGAGRHALHLQGRGYDVLGTDISPLAVEVCKARGLKNAEIVPLEEITPELGTFDTVLMMGNNFGLFGGPKKAKTLLRRLGRVTSADAVIVASSNDVYRTSNPVHLRYQEWNRERGRLSGQIRMRARFRQYATAWYDYLMVSEVEMKQILEGTGWGVERFIESDRSTYIAIIRKGLGPSSQAP